MPADAARRMARDAEPGAVPAPRPEPLLAQRLRYACWVALAVIPLYALADTTTVEGGVAALVAVRLLQAAFLVVVVVVLYRTGSPRTLRRLALGGVALICLSTAVSGVIAADPIMPPLLLCVLALSAAIAFPWGMRAQLWTVAMAALAIGLHLTLLPAPLPALPPSVMLATLTALVASVLIAWEMERHRADIARCDRALSDQRRRQDALIEALPLTLHRAVLRGNESGRMWLSANVERLTGFPAERFAGPDAVSLWAERVHPDDRTVFSAAFAELGTQRAATSEYRWQHADGSYRWLLSQAVLMTDEHGQPSEVIGSLLDRTERKQAEEELKDNELRYRLVTLATNDLVWDWDFATDTVRRNDGGCALFGYSPADVGGTLTWWTDHIHPDDRARILAGLEMFVRGGAHAWRDEYRFRCQDGSYAFVEDRGYVVRDEQGHPTRMIGALTDVTMRKQAEENLRRSETHFRSLIEKGSDLFGIVGPDGAMRYVSPSHLTVLGYRPDELLGRTAVDFVHPDDLGALVERFAGVVGDAPLEFRFRHADGSWRVLETRMNDLTADPDVGGMVTNSRDITDRKRAEAELQRAKISAEAASRVKSEFVANMSHEIRTPMNAILGMTELALDTELTAEQREYLETVRAAGDWLLTLLNDVLDFSKLEAGKVVIDPIEFPLRAMLHETLRILMPRAHVKGLELTCAVEPSVPDAIVGDPGRLRQVLVNLLSNGIKFAEHGSVVVEVTAQPVGNDDEIELRVRVRDTGIGIPAGQHTAIFDPFVQADSSTTRRYGGTGLGLAIAKQLVAMMGGTIGVESVVGSGSTFRFTARVRRAAERLLDHPHREAAAGSESLAGRVLHVLLAEDNVVNQRLAVRLLEKYGHRIRVVANGRDALTALACERFDVVLMDVQMPEMDGLDATVAIRRLEVQGCLAQRRVPIVAMTAHALSGDRERCLAAGMDDYVSKPIQVRGLFDAIARVVAPVESISIAAVS